MGGTPSKPGDPSRGLEVIGAGFSRTGTVSMQLALEKILDGPVIHGGTHMISREDDYQRKWIAAYEARRRGDKERTLKLLRELTAGYVGITDLPGINFIPELREIYPGAKVVLVTRDPERWWQSVGAITKNTSLWYLPYITAPVPGWRWIPAMIAEFASSTNALLGLREGEKDPEKGGPRLIGIHNQLVRDQVPQEYLLEMELKEGWAPLSKFLGRPAPDEPFPRANDSEAVQQVAQDVLTKCALAWLGIFSGAGVGLYTGLRLWKRL
ncbi:nad dependent epimerase dehydratase [Apiospora kogelbergensis]|uniref:Nad dependent epimerase dehydratase n=1 Tax=Apiospora kogelbergensis TaxID=1337665 RepID=A0AAW0QET8_9PEZI